MKIIHHYNTARDKLLHIETEMAIVNIRVGLSNDKGQEICFIEILPGQYAGEKIKFEGSINNRLVRIKECLKEL